MSFIDDLNKVGKSTEQVNDKKIKNSINNCSITAKKDYDDIKALLLRNAETKGYIERNGKKYVECLFTPSGICGQISRGLDVELKKTLFGGVKMVHTYRSEITPKDSFAWNYYINDIKNLSKVDGISISPVVYDVSHNKIVDYCFPTVIDTNKNVACVPKLMLHCTIFY